MQHKLTLPSVLREISMWPVRRWVTAVCTAVVVVVVTAIPTAMIPTPFFARDIPVTTWAWPVLIVTSVLVGMVTATYVARNGSVGSRDNGSTFGMLGTVATFFAVGCPVCNKLVLLALGYTGAMKFFAPVQPVLAVLAVVVLVWALITRVRGENACQLTS